MAQSVGINPACASFTYELRNSIEHARFGFDLHPRIAEKENIGISGVEESLNAWRRVVLWINDVHTPLLRFILAINSDASRRRLRPYYNDAGHPICFEELPQFLFQD